MDSWTTFNEIIFLQGLGRHSRKANFLSRKKLLQNYLKSMNRRKKWGNINSIQVREFVLIEIIKEDSRAVA